jgi:hypothetical protein
MKRLKDMTAHDDTVYLSRFLLLSIIIVILTAAALPHAVRAMVACNLIEDSTAENIMYYTGN